MEQENRFFWWKTIDGTDISIGSFPAGKYEIPLEVFLFFLLTGMIGNFCTICFLILHYSHVP